MVPKYGGIVGINEGGGLTVTVKLELAMSAQASVAFKLTVVVPTANALPLAGVALMPGAVQPPLAVALKVTLDEVIPDCNVTVILAGGVMAIVGALVPISAKRVTAIILVTTEFAEYKTPVTL
jgi:hypothetical protein